MNLKLVFKVSGVLTETHPGQTTEFMTGIMRNLAVTRTDWRSVARNNLVLYSNEIDERFLSECNVPFLDKKQDAMFFTSFIHKDPLITEGSVMIGNGDQFGFRLEYTLTSEEYTCLDILSDKTFVCFSESDRSIRFFKTSDNCVAEVI